MLFGMVTQIICGCITGLTSQFGIHMFFRFLSAVCCAQMFTAGQMICKYICICIFYINQICTKPNSDFSYGHHRRKIPNHCGVSVRNILVTWRYCLTSARINLSRLVEPVFAYQSTNGAVHRTLVPDSRFAQVVHENGPIGGGQSRSSRWCPL